MGRLVGYARVSNGEQALQLQFDALKTAGYNGADMYIWGQGVRCSWKPASIRYIHCRPQPNDTLAVWRLDRLRRSMPHLEGLVEELLGRGIGFRSLLDGAIDMTTATGELMFNI